MNVVSLFDGISCGQLALRKAGIPVTTYFASEVGKNAIRVTQHNFPDTIQLGDVTAIDGTMLAGADLLMGGSPCQGFSNAGKGLNFEDPRSALFFEFVRLRDEIGPKYFLLENVNMKAEWRDIISQYLGVEPIRINSSDFVPALRDRWYWTNIPIEPWVPNGSKLADILEDGFVDREKSYCIDANYAKGGNLKQYYEKSRRQLVFMKQLAHGFNKGFERETEKAPTLTTSGWQHNNFVSHDKLEWRKLTPRECERLQGVPDDYTACVSDTARYHALGNGWTVDVIAHIFKGLAA
jgi:site-specific DNA-cytosine methylase